MTPEQKAIDRFNREQSACAIRRNLMKLKEELGSTPVKIPPRFGSLISDFERWLNSTYPDVSKHNLRDS